MAVGGSLDLRSDPRLATQVVVSSSSNPNNLVGGIRRVKETTIGEERTYSGLREVELVPTFNHHSWQRSKNPSPPSVKLIRVLKPSPVNIAVFPTHPIAVRGSQRRKEK